MQDTGRASASGASELFQLLRNGQTRTRSELASVTGLARSTIALRIDELMSLGLISRSGDSSVSTGGRPPAQFALNPSSRLVLAADLGATHATIGLADLSGATISHQREPMNIAAGPEAVLRWTLDEGMRQLAALGRPKHDLVALGIGLPGPVEHRTGRAINPPIMPGWDGFDVPGWLQREIDVPVLVDNDVNIMALAEKTVVFPEVDDLFFVKVATGIGAGIISGGTLQRGAQGIAGDIGHVQVPRGNGTACRCGNTGCLEAIAAAPALAGVLRARGLEATDGRDVVALLREGNTDAIQALRQAGRDIGEVLATCVSLVNPSVIAIGGSMAQAGEHLIAGIREVVYSRSAPLATGQLQIVQSKLGADAALIGAGMLAVQYALSPESITAMASH